MGEQLLSSQCEAARHDLCDELDQRTPHHCDCPCHSQNSTIAQLRDRISTLEDEADHREHRLQHAEAQVTRLEQQVFALEEGRGVGFTFTKTNEKLAAAEAQVTALQGEVEALRGVSNPTINGDPLGFVKEKDAQLTALRTELKQAIADAQRINEQRDKDDAEMLTELEQAQAMTTRHIRVSKELMADRDAEKGRAERAEAVLRDISGRLKGPAFGHPSSDYIATLADEALDAALTPPSSKAEARQQAQS